jgi:hypothetical protein
MREAAQVVLGTWYLVKVGLDNWEVGGGGRGGEGEGEHRGFTFDERDLLPKQSCLSLFSTVA